MHTFTPLLKLFKTVKPITLPHIYSFENHNVHSNNKPSHYSPKFPSTSYPQPLWILPSWRRSIHPSQQYTISHTKYFFIWESTIWCNIIEMTHQGHITKNPLKLGTHVLCSTTLTPESFTHFLWVFYNPSIQNILRPKKYGHKFTIMPWIGASTKFKDFASERSYR